MELQTKRLILRPWQESDAEALYKYAGNPNIGPIAGWPPHTSVENSREIIKSVLSAPESYAVVLKTTGEVVGSVGIMAARSETHTARIADYECEIGYWIGEPYWGQGLIPEAVNELLRYAFEELRMAAVWCGYYDGNEKSKRVQAKCGFTYSHTEYDKPAPLMNDIRTEHYTKLTQEEWRNNQIHKGIGNSLKEAILERLCYTESVYGRINRKLGLHLLPQEIESFVSDIIKGADEMHILKEGKNYYITNDKESVRITVNSFTYRVITADRV